MLRSTVEYDIMPNRDSTLFQLAVIGFPIAHSLSPKMHQAALDAMGLPYCYTRKEVKPEELAAFVEAVKRTHSLEGFNVTIPHKEAILPYLDYVDPLARAIGAVNTVYWNGDRLCGTNTDVLGFSEAVLALHLTFSRKTACVLGAGGAARAVLAALSEAPFSFEKVYILNRTVERAHALAQDFSSLYPKTTFQTILVTDAHLESVFSEVSMVINALSLKSDADFFAALPFDRTRPDTLFSDINYVPHSPFLSCAKRLNRMMQNGEAMFIHQGKAAFKIWTGVTDRDQALFEMMQAAIHQIREEEVQS